MRFTFELQPFLNLTLHGCSKMLVRFCPHTVTRIVKILLIHIGPARMCLVANMDSENLTSSHIFTLFIKRKARMPCFKLIKPERLKDTRMLFDSLQHNAKPKHPKAA
jgi:hypothetical protein